MGQVIEELSWEERKRAVDYDPVLKYLLQRDDAIKDQFKYLLERDAENHITLNNEELRKLLDGIGYDRIFNAIAASTEIVGGTTIGVSVEKFIKSLTGVSRTER